MLNIIGGKCLYLQISDIGVDLILAGLFDPIEAGRLKLVDFYGVEPMIHIVLNAHSAYAGHIIFS